MHRSKRAAERMVLKIPIFFCAYRRIERPRPRLALGRHQTTSARSHRLARAIDLTRIDRAGAFVESERTT
jgi:hypothetical protein